VTTFPDVVVLIPGIGGSALAKNKREVWGTSGGALWRAVSGLGKDIRELALEGDDPEVDHLDDGVEATRLIPDLHMIPGLWKIDGYSTTKAELVKRFGLKFGKNYFDFSYDWRRDNRVSARKLQKLTRKWLQVWRSESGNADAKLVLVGHSMGGVVSRYFLEVLEGWRDTRTLITFGTPYRGSLNAVGFLANGYAKSIGPLNLDFSETIRTFTALYQLLPTYPCITTKDGGLVRVSEASGLPNVDSQRAAAALAFHDEIRVSQQKNSAAEEYQTAGYTIFPIVGIEQPTFQSAMFDHGKLELQRELLGKDPAGDGTVPRPSATPIELSTKRLEQFVAEQHASLQNFGPALTGVIGALTGKDIDWPTFEDTLAALTTVSLDLQDVYAAGPIEIKAKPSTEVTLDVLLTDIASGASLRQVLQTSTDGVSRATVTLPPGSYRVTVGGGGDASPVTDTFLVVEGVA
jgi:Lecithin:cholesterol acyltransferase